MQNNESEALLFFKHELDSLSQYILKLKDDYEQIMIEKRVSTEQSSESWHDNFMFEESQRKLKLLQNQIDSASNAFHRSRLVDNKSIHITDKITIGTLVTIINEGYEKQYFIGGFMTSQEHPQAPHRNVKHISYKSALGETLIGRKVGERISALIGKTERNIKVIKIEI